jgi:predicted nucleic-acid-binding protein
MENKSNKEYIIDTNLLVSYFTKRNLTEWNIAQEKLLLLKKGLINIHLPSIIIAEVVYILSKQYDCSKTDLVNFLIAILTEEGIIAEDKHISLSALEFFETENLDFADCYLMACKDYYNLELITFDKKLNNKAKK